MVGDARTRNWGIWIVSVTLAVCLGGAILGLVRERSRTAPLVDALRNANALIQAQNAEIAQMKRQVSEIEHSLSDAEEKLELCRNVIRESSRDEMNAAQSTPGTNTEQAAERPSPSSGDQSPASPEPDRRTLRGFEGTYSASSGGIDISLTILDADDVIADGIFYSTNAGTRPCAVYMIGDMIGLVFLDSSELRLDVVTGSVLRFQESGILIRRQ
jgi:hypothetical protein